MNTVKLPTDLPDTIFVVYHKQSGCALERIPMTWHIVSPYRYLTPEAAWADAAETRQAVLGHTDPEQHIVVRANLSNEVDGRGRPAWTLDWSETYDPVTLGSGAA